MKAGSRGLLVVALAGGLACRGPAPAAVETPIRVAVSVPPQAYFVDRIGGERVLTQVMVPTGAEPHSYEPSPQQVLTLGGARLYVKIGHPDFPFEKQHLEPLLAAQPALEVVDMAAGVELLPVGAGVELREDGGGPGPSLPRPTGGETDPHIWLAPSAVRIACANIAAALVRVDPSGETIYRENLRRLLDDIDRLDRELRATLGGVRGRSFLVLHPAWGYFAEEYGLEQVAVETGGKEPSAARLVALIDAARRAGVRAVFIQRGFAEHGARVLAREIGAEVITIDPLAYDWLANLRQVGELLREALSGERVATDRRG